MYKVYGRTIRHRFPGHFDTHEGRLVKYPCTSLQYFERLEETQLGVEMLLESWRHLSFPVTLLKVVPA